MFAGYHYDLNFLTIHGRSRFPGLNIWLRNGQKVEVKVPVGCLLIHAGKQVRVFLTIVLSSFPTVYNLVDPWIWWLLWEINLDFSCIN